jgi:predicted regulator of Ras-like GTPase activity (Roadblock/LC7/MglB family)
MFSEPAKDYAPNTIPPYPAGSPANSEQPPADPLGLASGSYPQINSIDLQKATSARLAKTIPTDESQGRIKGLGNFLLDEQSAAAIGNLSSSNTVSNARILSDEEAMALQECLSPIERLQGVAGCIILGYDGMVIMSSLPEHADKDALSAWALLTYMNSHDLIRVIGHARLRQFVSRTISGYLLLADFGQGLLLAVSDNASTEAILPLMKSVRKVTAA